MAVPARRRPLAAAVLSHSDCLTEAQRRRIQAAAANLADPEGRAGPPGRPPKTGENRESGVPS